MESQRQEEILLGRAVKHIFLFFVCLGFFVCLFCFPEGQLLLFLRTENRVFKVDDWDITIINLISLVAKSHARIVFSLLKNPSYLGMHHKVMNSGSQGNGKAILQPTPREWQWN